MENKDSMRKGENEASPYRSGSFYSVDNSWYFSVRETVDQGPFQSKDLAEKSLKTYLMDFEHFNNKTIIKSVLKLV